MNSTVIVIIVVLIMGSIFAGLGFFLMKTLKSTDPKNSEVLKQQNSTTTQDFLPYKDVKDNVIDLGNFQYRAIIECKSINYELKTEGEQEMIELSFQRFLNGLNHPIQIFVQTRVMDNTKMMESLNNDILKSIETFPILETYGVEYSECMSHIYEQIQNNKEKKKYIVIPFNDAVELENATDAERYEYALKELQTRCNVIMDSLQGLGIKSERLTSKGLISVLYELFHKDSSSQAENLTEGEFTPYIVSGSEDLYIYDNNDEAKLDWILYETQNRLIAEIQDKRNTDEELKERTGRIVNNINEIRKDLAGYFKTEIKVEDKIKKYERGVN